MLTGFGEEIWSGTNRLHSISKLPRVESPTMGIEMGEQFPIRHKQDIFEA
jgi:hypothetical protein